MFNFQSGDVILFRNEFIWNKPVTYLATAIRYVTKCEYNHAAIVVSDWNMLMLNEALGGGTRCRPLQKYLKRTKTSIVVLRPKVPIIESDFCKKANSLLGIPYNIKGIFNQLIFRVFGIWTGHTNQFALDTMVCTQYVAYCHNLPNWWLYSDKELLVDIYFDVIIFNPKLN